MYQNCACGSLIINDGKPEMSKNTNSKQILGLVVYSMASTRHGFHCSRQYRSCLHFAHWGSEIAGGEAKSSHYSQLGAEMVGIVNKPQ